MLSRKKIILGIMLLAFFAGGFISGIYYSGNLGKEAYKPSSSSDRMEDERTDTVQSGSSKVVIGYVQDFRNPEEIDFSAFTHILFSFAHPTADGSVLFNGGMARENLRKTVSLAHREGTKSILSVGGWYHIKGGQSYPYFSAAISNPEARKNLVNNLIRIVETENLDGIDLDFEHPRTERDAANLELLAKELSEKLRPVKKELSIAVHSKINAVTGEAVESVIYKPGIFKAPDHVNIMAYDGQWDGGYHAENLAPYSFTENIVLYWSSMFDQLGIPREKLVLGLPLYGQPENQEAKQVSYAAIVEKFPSYAKEDSIAMNGTVYYYNGVETAKKKTRLAMANGFGGLMLWEAGHDSKGDTSLARAIGDEMKSIFFSDARGTANGE
ncbi:glycoside hydrolase family 18 protein [Neobacillus sp. YIM B06451]|uniref:glycoside hydrolase family 18 protein n=1 Tax=Neobacillus sp. YIM B06451 TaxID=3070994 RepID=UPI00292ED241|nr:glycoside hydrolase family 18 protein [Neobacillus sp. YIM B06451]